MFKVKNIIQGVTKFILDEKLLYYKKDNSIYKEDSIIIELDEDFFGEFYINNKYVIIQDYKENEIKIYDNQSKIKTLTGFYNYLVQSMILYLNKEDSYLYKFINDENVKLNFCYAGFLTQENYISIQKEKILSCDFCSSSLQWEFAIKKLGTYVDHSGKEKTYEVNKFFGPFYNTLLFVMEAKFILSLDFKTGNFVKMVNICEALQLDEKTFGNMRPYDMYLDIEKGQLLWLSFHYYIKVDATTLEPKLIKNYSLAKKEQWWNIKHSTPNNDFIVFNADYGDKRVSPDYLGVANIETGEILWSEKIIKKGFLINNPHATEDKLYQLDSNNNLHIYEKNK